MRIIKGMAAAAGMALAPAHIVKESRVIVENRSAASAQAELDRLDLAVSECQRHMERLMANLEGSVDPQTIEILDFQLLLLEDTDFMGKIKQNITDDLVVAEYAVLEASKEYIAYLENLTDNDYLRERTADVADLSQRLAAVLAGADLTVAEPEGNYIAIGTDIAPSLVAELDKKKLKGIILEKGGLTSHCVILAKSLGIPCLIEVAGIQEAARPGDMLLLDAVEGRALLAPDGVCILDYERYMARDAAEKASLEAYVHCASKTPDGVEIKVFANITTKSEAEEVVARGGEGIGLFRSELLYMSQTHGPPSEEKQFAEYSQAAKTLDGRPIVIRTLDVGGDKQIEYMGIGQEANPFLGYRAIRVCLDRPDIFKPQISAILRASAFGNVWMMFPMITNIDELHAAKQTVEQVKQELTAREIPYDPGIRVGMMVETPAAAFDAERLAGEVDFFSIGTNDLAQYLFAADRSNARLAGLNSCFQPTLLRVIHSIVKAAKAAGIEVDICGQAAEIDSLIPIWLSMGVDNLSVSIPRIPAVRKRICHTHKSARDRLLDLILRMDSADQVERTLRKNIEVL